MKNILLAAVIVSLTLPAQGLAQHLTFGGIHLLDGYTARRERAVDVTAWEIKGKHNFTIHFEAGDGAWANPKDVHTYSWYRERVVHGHVVRFALVKRGLKTQWEPSDNRGLPPGNVLLVTYILWKGTKLYPEHDANFSAKVANSGELGDALLMISTFDPSKGKF